MVEMEGKEYLLKLRKEQTRMREEILRLFTGKGTLSFQEIYLKMEEQYHRYCPFPYERDRILEGVVKNELGFTLDNHCDLDTFVGNAKSCVYHGDQEALYSLMTGEFSTDSVYVKDNWMYPAGAFHGAEGGPC